MRKLLVFQHVPFEPLGTLNDQFKAAGFRLRYVNFDRAPQARVDIDRYHGLVVLGGPMSADDTDRHPHLDYESDVIADAAEKELPVLGICLGAQLIARSFGGTTQRSEAPEFGWTKVEPLSAGRKDPLIGCLAGPEWIFQWHADTFSLPDKAKLLAKSATCRNQAFRIGDTVYGFQFHLEADRSLIARWLTPRKKRTDFDQAGLHLNKQEILAESDRRLPRAGALAHDVFGAFIERFYNLRRRRAQPSR